MRIERLISKSTEAHKSSSFPVGIERENTINVAMCSSHLPLKSRPSAAKKSDRGRKQRKGPGKRRKRGNSDASADISTLAPPNTEDIKQAMLS